MNRILTFIFLTLIYSTSIGQTAEEFNEKSSKFIETQEFDKAIPLLKIGAELGSAESQYNLGYCYRAG
ncbi:MAG: hypothetical protein QMB65_11985, partial [Vicingaceae bacterium]